MLSRQLRAVQSCLKRPSRAVSRALSSQESGDSIVASPFPDVKIPNLTISDYVWQNLDRWADHTAVVCGVTGHGYTYERLFRVSTTLAATLRTKFQFREGSCATVMLPNCPDYPVAALAAIAAGGTVSGINPLHTPYEVQRQLTMSDAKLIFTNTALTPVIKEALKLAKLDIPVIVIKSPEEVAHEGTVLFSDLVDDSHIDVSCLKHVKREANDVAFIHYSSGTTGLPKGVELTHKNVVANNEQINEPTLRHTKETTATYQDAVMGILPFFHSYGSTVVMLNKLAVGAKIVTLPKFQPEVFFKNMKRYRTRVLYAAPPMVLAMATHPQSSAECLAPLDIIMCGAAPIPTADVHRLFEKAQRKFTFIQAYGLTETSPVATITPTSVVNYSTIGLPVPNSQVKIVDSDGNVVKTGQSGEILIKGPNVMRGYRNNAEATADAIRAGWFHSGDLGYLGQDGALYMSDRLKELIKVKGFQVAPAELEGILKEHPGVLDAAVVGVSDPRTGEIPKAFVVKKSNASVSSDDIKDFVNKKVAPYKKIGELMFLEDIPRNPSGKILRREIRDKYC